MTTAPAERDPVERLIDEVRMTGEEVAALHDELVEVRRRTWRQGIALAVGAIVVAVMLGLVVAVFHIFDEQDGFNSRQACVNHRSRLFFAAEHDKVAGQIAGLKKLRAATTQTGGLAGFDEFITASQHYLDAIAEIGDRCR